MQGSSGGGIREIVGRHNKNTGQVEKLKVYTWDLDYLSFGDDDSSGVVTYYNGGYTDQRSCLGYLGGVMEEEVTRVDIYWVPL